MAALVVSGNDVYAGGYFTSANGGKANFIAKWNGSTWSALGSGVGDDALNAVSALALLGSDLYVGGRFLTAGGKVSAYLARAYLLDLPTLSLRRSDTHVTVSWPSTDTVAFALEHNSSPVSTASWVPNAIPVIDDGIIKSVTVPATNSSQIFRLRRP